MIADRRANLLPVALAPMDAGGIAAPDHRRQRLDDHRRHAHVRSAAAGARPSTAAEPCRRSEQTTPQGLEAQ